MWYGHPKPKMISAPYPCQFLRLRSQDFSSECFDTLENTTRLTSAHWHASLWSTSPFPPCSHAVIPLRVRTEPFFSAVRRRKDSNLPCKFRKGLQKKAAAPGALLCELFWLCTINTPFRVLRSVADLPGKKGYSLGLIIRVEPFDEREEWVRSFTDE